MIQRFFIFDPNRCFGCNGCSAACANINHTPPGILWRTLHKLPPYDGDHRTVYLSVSCNHCENPPCVKGCPANALEKRQSDGAVIHHKNKCLGCRYCQMVCPYDAIKWDDVSKVVSKCHFCYERLDKGQEPACVETCFGGALKQERINIENIPDSYETESPGLNHVKTIGPCIRFIKNANPSQPKTGR
ncbi:MAG: 4Fe-4S dicluster domain-containing protein [Candidatus Omnitrophota bacterium]